MKKTLAFTSIALSIGLFFQPSESLGQTYGPPNFIAGSSFEAFLYSETDPSDGLVRDYYGFPTGQYGPTFWITSDFQVHSASRDWPIYHPDSFLFDVPDSEALLSYGMFRAVDDEKTFISTAEAGITLLLPTDFQIGDLSTSPSGSRSPDASFRRADGLQVVKYFSPGNPVNFNLSGLSNSYEYDGIGEVFIDASVTSPPQNPFPSVPTILYVNRNAFRLLNIAPTIGETSLEETLTFKNTVLPSDITIYRGQVDGSNIGAVALPGVGTFSYDPLTWAISGLPDGIRVRFTAPDTCPTVGPAALALNGEGLAFQFTDNNGNDIYQNGTVRLTIGVGGTAKLTDLDTGALLYAGTYNPTTHKFDFGAGQFGTILAYNASGNLIGTSTQYVVPSDTEFAGGIDIRGNTFTLGTWVNPSGSEVNGLAISFGVNPASLRFDAIRPGTDWIWADAASVGNGMTETMRLTATGNLGLGTPSPVNKIELHKVYANGGLAEGPDLGFTTDNSSDSWSLGAIAGYLAAGLDNSIYGYPGGLLFKTKDAGGSPSTPPTTKMVLDAAGHLGIGTATPTEKLQVEGNLKVTGVIRTTAAAGDISMGEFTAAPAP